MNSTLKPHLLIEVIGLQRRPLPPEGLCMLFLGYHGFSDAYALAFRYRCEVRHSNMWRFRPDFVVTTSCGITFMFNKSFHIPDLLRIAGRHVHRIDKAYPDEAWIEPFLQGIDENQHVQYINCRAFAPFLQRYLQHHCNHLPTVECTKYSIFDTLEDPLIDKLVVKDVSSDENIKKIRIESIEVFWVPRNYINPLNDPRRGLKYDRKFLKSMKIHGELLMDVALRMIKATFPKVEYLELDNVKIPFPKCCYEIKDNIDRINLAIHQLKTAMDNHPGTVSVNAFYKRHVPKPGPIIAATCRTDLTGFSVKERDGIVECKLQLITGSTSLNVCADLSYTSHFFV
uniref:Lariat debranching enzyme n=1 Tax=Panagrellus redivivus TaxID=6233 RepID=A0A7E4VII9_PANRE